MMTVKKLTVKDIQKHHKSISDWQLNKANTELSRSFNFTSFINGLSFIARIAVHAEILGHHPDIEMNYGKVKVKLTTHDVKGLSKLDFDLAKSINTLKLN